VERVNEHPPCDHMDELGKALVRLGNHLVCWLRTMFLLGITALIIAGVVEWIGSLLR
jgi:hypothetical protein